MEAFDVNAGAVFFRITATLRQESSHYLAKPKSSSTFTKRGTLAELRGIYALHRASRGLRFAFLIEM